MDRLNKTKDDISSKPLDTREIVYTSLLLLGFVPREMEDKYNIPFTRDMFSLPNKRGFEVVMQFLFERLNPALSRERFRHCWPILDKKQEQTFRKTISNWLTEISKEDEDANLPRIVPSLFMSPGGDKFYTLLFYFTSFVMVKTCKNDHGVKSRDLLHHCTMTANTRQYAPVMAQTIQASTVTPRKKFLNVTQETVHLQRQWKEYANDLVKAHRSLCKRIRELEHSIKEEESKMITNAGSSVVSPGVGLRVRSSGMTDGEWDVLAVKRAQRIQKVRDLWQSVKVCCQEQADERAVVDSVTSERSKKDRLDAGDLPVQVPEILLRECEREIQRRRINNVYDGGKLDLVSLIKLWNLSLRLYLEKLNEAPVPDFEERMPSVVTQVHTQNSHLANARALRNSLAEEVLPDLQKSVSQLLKYNEDGVELPTRDRMVKASPHHFLGKGVGLLPPTPPVSFEPAASSKAGATPLRKASSLFTKSPENVGTPEVMTKLRESVMETALKKAGLAQGTPTSTLREVRIPSKRERKIPVPAKTKDFSRQRYKSATSERDTQETPVSTKSKTSSRKDGTFRHPSNKRMVQTTVKKKKRPSSFQRPSETFQQPVTRAHSNRDVQKPEDGRETTFGSLTQNQPTVDRAQSKLIEQIVESVVSSSSERSSPTLTPEMLSGDNSSSVPILAVEDPLRALDLDAFASRDKIRHSPLEKLEDFSLDNGPNHQLEHVEASSDSSIDGSTLSAATSQNGAEFSQSMQLAINHEAPVVETGLLIDLDNNDSPPPSGIISDKKASYHSELNPDFASWNVTLQRASSSSVNSARSPARPTLGGLDDDINDDDDASSLTKEDLEGAIVVEDLLEFVETEKSQNETEEVEGFMELSESQQSNRNDSSGAEARAGEFSPSLENASTLRNPYELPSPSRGNLLESPEIDIHLKETSEKEDTSSWHLDEELSDIFQTRTPQLPARLRRKLESADGSPLSSSNVFPSSQCALSLERNPSPGSGNTHSQSGSIPEARRLDLTSSLKDDNSVEDGLDWPQNKSRSKSGSSQKSVSFLEPADERNNDKNGSESMARQTESISDETMPTIGEEWLTSPGDPNGPPTTTNLFSMEGGSLGEEYLISSPKPPVNHTGYIDDAFSIDLESPDSGDVSFAMNRPIEDLLEHISPALSPSKTPQITRVSRVSNRRLPTPDMTPELPIKTRPRTTGVDDTPVIRRDQDRQELSLSQRMASIRMTSGSLGINGSPGHLYNTDTAEFNLLEEDESLLVPTSPVQ